MSRPEVLVAVTLLRGALGRAGWLVGDRGGAHTLIDLEGRWPAGWAPPQIVARPVTRPPAGPPSGGEAGAAGCLWWHWTAPAAVAGVPIAPVSDGAHVLRLVKSTLAKLVAHAGPSPLP